MSRTKVIARTVRLGVRGRLTLWFVLVAIGAVVFGGGVVYSIGLASIQGTLGQTYCQIAGRVATQFSDRIRQSSGFLGDIATDILTTEVALEQYEFTRSRSPDWIDARRARLADEWRGMTSATARAQALNEQLSHRLSVMAGLRDRSVDFLALYDPYGILLGASRAPGQRLADGEDWFHAIGERTDHFTYVDFDRASGHFKMATPVWAGVDIVGYVFASFNFEPVRQLFDNVRFGATGEAQLVDKAGIPLSGRTRASYASALADPPRSGNAIGDRSTGPYWISTAVDAAGPLWHRLICVAPTDSVNAMRANFTLGPWAVVVTQSPAESYESLRRSLGFFALTGLLGVIVAGAGGAVMAWRIAAPMIRLREDVRRFGQGERDRMVEIARHDEIGELADEFNQMAARVRDSENELRAFAQAVADAGDAIIMTGPNGAITYVNAAFERITGYSARELKGKDPALLRAGRTAKKEVAAIGRAVRNGEYWHGEIWNRRKSGEVYPTEISISPIRDDAGRCIAFIGIQRDVSSVHEYQERLEREVEARTREIRRTEGLIVLGRMASMIAHDLRNALSTVQMNLQILLRRHSSPEDVENEPCRMGLEQVHYMEEILRDILTFARPGELKADWHDMSNLMEEAVASVAGQCSESGIEIIHHFEPRLPKVYCDRVKIGQVLRNLLQNAITAMPDGGKLSLDCNIILEVSEPSVVLKIKDNGEGMPQDVLANIFEPFFTTRARGTGLGLAIVKRLIDLHGGTIDIDSTEEEGTTVTVLLPTAQAAG